MPKFNRRQFSSVDGRRCRWRCAKTGHRSGQLSAEEGRPCYRGRVASLQRAPPPRMLRQQQRRETDQFERAFSRRRRRAVPEGVVMSASRATRSERNAVKTTAKRKKLDAQLAVPPSPWIRRPFKS